MKIAVESNDGETIKSPFEETRGYLVFDVIDDTLVESKYLKINKPIPFTEIPHLTDCKTIITREMNRTRREQLRDEGFDIFVTFNTYAKDALDSFVREKLIYQPEFV